MDAKCRHDGHIVDATAQIMLLLRGHDWAYAAEMTRLQASESVEYFDEEGVTDADLMGVDLFVKHATALGELHRALFPEDFES